VGRHERDQLQAVLWGGVRQERHGAGSPALPLQGVRLQLHGHAGARQAGGDEGAGGAALRPGQRQPGHDRPAPGGEPCGRPQVGPGGGRDRPGTLGRGVGWHRPDRRDVALREREKNKVWLWRAYDPVARRTLAWELGGRDDATCRRLLDKVGIEGHVFLTDDWEGFHRLIPAEQLFTGKDLTFPIEQDNGDVRHYLARFRRRSKVTSRARHMVDTSLRLLHHLMQPKNFLLYRDNFLSIFG
jgi:insertion element IS1 protein InsB